MPAKVTADLILEAVKQNPGQTRSQIAKLLKVDYLDVTFLFSKLIRSKDLKLVADKHYIPQPGEEFENIPVVGRGAIREGKAKDNPKPRRRPNAENKQETSNEPDDAESGDPFYL